MNMRNPDNVVRGFILANKPINKATLKGRTTFVWIDIAAFHCRETGRGDFCLTRLRISDKIFRLNLKIKVYEL